MADLGRGSPGFGGWHADVAAAGFAGSRKISGTEKLWEHLEKTPCNRIDARSYLKAKLMDFLIGDKDRHYGQWRWARFLDGDCFTWIPIPEDRDQAFIDFDGFAMAVARRGLPRQIEFSDAYSSLVGLSTTGWEMDREFLVERDKTAFWHRAVSGVGKLLCRSGSSGRCRQEVSCLVALRWSPNGPTILYIVNRAPGPNESPNI